AVGALDQEPGLPDAQVETELACSAAQRGAVLRDQIELAFAAIGKAGEGEQVDALGGKTGQHSRTPAGLVGHHHVKVIDFAHTLAHGDSFTCTAGVETLQRPARRVNDTILRTACLSKIHRAGAASFASRRTPRYFASPRPPSAIT